LSGSLPVSFSPTSCTAIVELFFIVKQFSRVGFMFLPRRRIGFYFGPLTTKVIDAGLYPDLSHPTFVLDCTFVLFLDFSLKRFARGHTKLVFFVAASVAFFFPERPCARDGFVPQVLLTTFLPLE